MPIPPVGAIRRLDDVSFADLLTETITGRQNIFPTSVISSALDTLAYIKRNEEDKTKTREFITNFVNSKNPRIQQGAIQALGTLGDAKSLALIETFTSNDPQLAIQRTANQARDRLNTQQRAFAPSEVTELARSVEQLKTDSQRLQQEFEDLKKQLSASGQSRRPRRTEPNDVNTPSQTGIIE